jgi:hypothetical protein
MVRTGILDELEHFVAYAGSVTIAVAGYRRRGVLRIIGLIWIYAGVLKYLQNFSPNRHPSTEDFGGIGARSVLRRGLRKHVSERLLI